MKTYKVIDPDACPRYLKIMGSGATEAPNVSVPDRMEEEGLIYVALLAKDWGLKLVVLLEILKEAHIPLVKRSDRRVVDEAAGIEAIKEHGLQEGEMLYGDFVQFMYSTDHTIQTYLKRKVIKPIRKIGTYTVFSEEQAVTLAKVMRIDRLEAAAELAKQRALHSKKNKDELIAKSKLARQKARLLKASLRRVYVYRGVPRMAPGPAIDPS